MYMILTFILIAIIYVVLIKYNVGVPYAFFALILGFISGTIIYYYKEFDDSKFVFDASSADMRYIYLPMLSFRIAFCLDVHSFFKSFPQILIVAIPVCIFSGIMTGMVMLITIDKSWPIWAGVLFGFLCSPCYGCYVVHVLREMTNRTKQTILLLEGESLISIIPAVYCESLINAYYNGFVVWWYQFLAIVIRGLLIGAFFGYLVGLTARRLIRKTSSDNSTVLSVVLGFPFVTYTLTRDLFGASGSAAIMVLGLMMAEERSAILERADQLLVYFWQQLVFIIDVILCLKATKLAVAHVIPTMGPKDYILIVVTYLVYYIMRFASFLLSSPILSRLGLGVTFKELVVCAWSGLRSPVSLMIMMICFYRKEMPEETNRIIFAHIMGLHLLTLFINGGLTPILLKALGMTDVSVQRYVNMNACMRHIFEKRERTVAVLKTDRIIADVNWSLVHNATHMKNPYALDSLLVIQDDDWYMGFQFAFCPDCKNEILQEPTDKQFKDMTREGRMRILKSKKISYSRQYENGMMSQETIRILMQAVELAMDSEEAVIVLDGLCARFNEKNRCFSLLDGCVKRMANDEVYLRTPRNHCKRFCHSLVINKKFAWFMYSMVILNVIILIIHMTQGHARDPLREELMGSFLFITVLFCGIYFVEFIIRILAYAWRNIWKDGFGYYFKSPWNIIDFIVLWTAIIDLVLTFSIAFATDIHWEMFAFLDTLRMVRIAKLLRLLEHFQPIISRYLDGFVDSRMACTYELGKCYVTGDDEILIMLPYIIDNDKIKEDMRLKLEDDRLTVIKLLGLVQKDKPWVAITVKTRQAIRTILCAMNESIEQAKISGWIDDFEYKKLMESMDQLHKDVGKIKSVQPSPPKVLFKEVAWMEDEKKLVDFLYDNVNVKKFETGELLFDEGKVADGIYIVVTGFLKISYVPDEKIIMNLREYGRLPIVDYASCIQYADHLTDYIVSGSCVGELSVLTGRPYNCKVAANSQTQVYVLNRNTMRRAMEEVDNDPIEGLECRIWKAVSIRIVLPILLCIPMYESSPQKVKYALERAFVPNLSKYKVFHVNDLIQCIILIEGVAVDDETRDVYIAPCSIPRTVQKLILSTSNEINIPRDVDTKLLIVPNQNVKVGDIMAAGEEACEMTAETSLTKCLQHTVQKKTRKRGRTLAGRASTASNRQRLSKVKDDEQLRTIYTEDISPGSASPSVFLSMTDVEENESDTQKKK